MLLHSSSSNGDTDIRRDLVRDSWQSLEKSLPRLSNATQGDHIHDARVAARRFRALLRSMRDEANPLAYAQLKFDLTNLGRELGDVRDADVRVRLIDNLLSMHPLPNEHDLRGLRKLLNRMAESARRRLSKRLDGATWRQRLARIRDTTLDAELVLRQPKDAGDEVRAMLVVGFDKGLRALKRTKRTARSLHKQRISLKCTRYVGESLLPYVGIKGRRTLAGLHEAQDLLGEIHDLAELIGWLRRFSVPTPLHDLLIERATDRYEKRVRRYARTVSALQTMMKGLKRQIKKNAQLKLK